MSESILSFEEWERKHGGFSDDVLGDLQRMKDQTITDYFNAMLAERITLYVCPECGWGERADEGVPSCAGQYVKQHKRTQMVARDYVPLDPRPHGSG